MFEILPNHEVLWDKGNKQHKDAMARWRAWEDITKELGDKYSHKHLQKWWDNIRDTYRKVCKKIHVSGASNEIPKGISERMLNIYRKLQFLQ